MKILRLVLIFFSICSTIYAQQIPDEFQGIRIDLDRLRDYSLQYDKYKQYNLEKFVNEKEKYTELYSKRAKYAKLYKEQIYKIKYGPKRHIYIRYLDKAIGVDSAKYKEEKGFEYTFVFSLVSRRSDTMPTLFEYYKVVKYSLFTLDKEELLPPKEVPFLKYKAQ
ncbi:hypothetical protein [Sphingobacterium siyangense]|uniref:hypothetical protein n=1 Tax=Sphingobacterium siyangense TaxID=459529 RepID=UPI002FDAA557